MKTKPKLLAFGILQAAHAWLGPTLLAQSTYEPYTFTTLAGRGAGDAGSADGSGSAASFYYPSGVSVDTAGNVYVADSENSTIRKVTPTGVVTTLAGLAGSPGSTDGTGPAALFDYPSGVAVDSAGNVYVADSNNSTIRRVTPTRVVTTLAGLAGSPGSTDGTGSDARFSSPQGVAVDTAGNVYVADTNNSTIRKVTPTGVVTTLAGLAGSPGSADGTGRDPRFSGPLGVAVDTADNVYVADTHSSTIRKVTPAGVVTTLAGLAGSLGSADGMGSDARFGTSVNFPPLFVYGPSSVAVDSAGNVYLADLGNSTIRKLTSVGTNWVVTTLAGQAHVQDSADGTGAAALFSWPGGVAVDTAGNVYVADTQNNTIRKGYPATRILNSGLGFGFNGGQFGFNLAGQAGQAVVVEASTDLVSWLPLWTNTITFPAALNFSEPQSGASSKRFYRARMP